MAQDIINKNQDISYTNLDFSSIYTEVIELAKQLSYRWDPSISDESDPGVVLLKLSALIADKMNYNIDKSVLEAFPLSVTQEGNARQLYEQLGYYMNWYESATVPVSITWIGEDKSKDIVYTIPKFTMITDSETSRTYALIGTNDGSNLVVSDGKLPKDGSTIQMIAMEGTPTTFSFLGETKITSQMIDENNRLYFETKYISQNGIFIKNSGNDQDNYLEWKRVDNLYEQPYNDLRYKLGIDSKSDVAYLEFPDNYAELIGSGIEIVYFIIDPEFNNIPAQALDRFLVNINPKENTEISLTLENTKISNLTPAYGHKNVESINEAYTNYKRTVGTFKTLITLRDYLNYILLQGSELCSNGFVTDRTNDPQLSYKIMSKSHGIDSLITEVESNDNYIFADIDKFDKDTTYYKRVNGEFIKVTGDFDSEDDSDDESETVYYTKETIDKLSPFSLKFYLLQDVLSVNSKSTFDQTFDMLSSEDMSMVNVLIDEASHIEHTYEEILPFGENTYKKSQDTSIDSNKSYYVYDKELDKYNFISNSYYALTHDTTIYPYYTLEITPVSSNFSDDTIYYSEISNGYKREKITPTSGTYYTIEETRLDTNTFTPGIDYYIYSTGTYTLADTSVPPSAADYYRYNSQYGYYYKIILSDEYAEADYSTINPSENSWYNLYTLSSENNSPKLDNWYEINVEALSPHIAYFRAKYPLYMTISTYSVVGEGVKNDIKTNILNAFYENLNSTKLDFGEKIELDYLTEIVLGSDTRIKSVLFDNIEYQIEALYYDKEKNTFINKLLPKTIALPIRSDENSVISYNIAKDIIAKSILAGVTKLLDKDTSFEYHLNQYYLYSNPINNIYSITSETIIDMNNINSAVNSDGYTTKNYTLKENELITLVKPKLKDIQSFETGVHYEYLIYSDVEANTSYCLSKNEYIVFYNTILDSNKNITGYKCRVYTNGAIIKPSINLPAQDSQTSMSDYFQTQLQPDIMTKSDYYYEYDTSSSYWITSIMNNSAIVNNVISGDNDITIQTINRVTIVPEDGYSFYWMLNKEEKSEATGKRYYKLFDEFDSVNDKKNNSIINSYTLKSGESLYYIDKDRKQLATLHAGATIIRNCGINEEYKELDPTLAYSFIPFDNTLHTPVTDPDSNFASPKLSGLYNGKYKTIQVNQSFNPEYTYYEKSGDIYVRTKDETPQQGKTYYIVYDYELTDDTIFIEDKTYYLLVMNSMSDYYEDNNGVYSPSGAITYNVFKPVSLTGNDLSEINPSTYNYFEIVKYENVEVEDYYNASDNEEKAINRPRFKHSDSSTVWSEQILQTVFDDKFKVNDESTYPNNITINSGNSSLFSPVVNSLFEVDSTVPFADKEFYTFYTRNEYVTIQVDQSFNPEYTYYEKVADDSDESGSSDDTYIETEDTTPQQEKIYYVRSEYLEEDNIDENYTQVIITNENQYYIPSHVGWYEKNNNDEYKKSTRMYAYKPKKAALSSSLTPFNAVTIENDSQDKSVLGYYYKFSTSDTTYIKTITNDPYIPISASINDVPSKLFEICRRIKIQAPENSIQANTVNSFWTSNITSALPSEFYAREFFKTNISYSSEAANQNYYVFVPITTFNTKSTSDVTANLINGELYIGDIVNDNTHISGVFFNTLNTGLISLFGITSSDKMYIFNTSTPYKQIDEYTNFDLWYSITRPTSNNTPGISPNKVPLYIIPNFYRFGYFVKSNFDNYYTVKTYVDKTFGTIAPWECDSLNSDSMVDNPVESLSKLWKPLQDNCSLTITENESYSLTEGDTISIIANYAQGSNELSIINYPVFSNTETILNLNNYIVSYVHGGSEISTLENLSIPNSAWRGYSSLLLNTSSESGQILENNHTLICYDSDGNTTLSLPNDLPNSDIVKSTDITFQLKYPINNEIGSHIDVVTYDDLGNEIPNNIYVFKRLINTDKTSYSSATHETSIVISKQDNEEAKTELPFKFPAGTYLLPVTGPEYLKSGNYSVYLSKFTQTEDENPQSGKEYYIFSDSGYYEETVIEEDFIEGINYYEKTETKLNDFVTNQDTFTDDKTYYLLIDIDSAENNYQLEFTFIGDSSVTEIKLILNDIFKFEKNSSLVDAGVFDEIFEKMKRLDTDTVYNYTFQPDENDLIENPLDPKSFWNKNHVYNSYVIPQLDLSSADNIDYRFITSK